MEIYEGMKFTKEHEWAREEGGKVYIGISDYAQNALGDIVYVELPETGKKVKAGDPISVVESVKTASHIFAGFRHRVRGERGAGRLPGASQRRPV